MLFSHAVFSHLLTAAIIKRANPGNKIRITIQSAAEKGFSTQNSSTLFRDAIYYSDRIILIKQQSLFE
ncbi:hypothetical protein CSC17_1349 [Klebsiella oxytoca]|nr:hypothetical protein CSC17_1349 [Klebsiella oxytoca]EUC82932.1 hypothetical protein HMPREF1570_5473 [Klebsiella oxytoca KA-2]EUC88380.1 hypothetical protein HMPREF1569_3445 [Klebsiella oxytoca OK-1]